MKLRVLLLAVALPWAAAPASAAPAAAVEEALSRASKFLLGQQDNSGAIWEKQPNMRNQTAMTSLAILALSALGHQPADPTPEGQAMRRGLDYVLQPKLQDPNGYFGEIDGSRMYGQGIITLMLSEMLGMGADAAQDELLLTRCRSATDLILRAQKIAKNDLNRGGWRYTPDSSESDMSVTVWQTMALRAAKNAGMEVPKTAVDDAVKFIRRCYDAPAENRPEEGGGFGYMSRGRELSTTAEGLLALQVCGEYDAPDVKAASDRLLNVGLKKGEKWFYYTGYYYAQGMYQRGGKYALEGRRVIAEIMPPLQQKDGSWEGVGSEERQGGKVYATSLAILSLAVKNHFLPIYQR